MPPNRTARPGSIPENLIVNWRPSNHRDGAKPLLRRPVTACDACRTAKAKCSGKQGCHRCTARGLICTYTHRTAPNHCLPRGDSDQPRSVQATSPIENITQVVPTVVPAGSAAAGDSPSSTECQPNAGLDSITPTGGTNVLQPQSIHPQAVNCGPGDTTLDVSLL